MKLRKKIAIAIAVLAVHIFSPVGETSELKTTSTEKKFRELAGQIGVLQAEDVFRWYPGKIPTRYLLASSAEPLFVWVFDESNKRVDTAALYPPNYQELMKAFFDTKDSVDSLTLLLSNSDPSVRMLACCALWNRNEPKLLPLLAKLSNDEAPTRIKQFVNGYGRPSPPTFQPTSDCASCEFAVNWKVGEMVRHLLALYVIPAGYSVQVPSRVPAPDGIPEKLLEPAFADYWKKHSHLRNCASWFAVRARRWRSIAHFKSDPECKKYGDHLRGKLRNDIQALPSPQKELTLLFCFDGGYDRESPLFSEQEALDAAKKLGPDRVLAFMQERSLTEDPDLDPKRLSENNQRVRIFFLKHAPQLLRPDQADALLACEQTDWQRKRTKGWFLVGSGYAAAAAQLDRKNSRQILHEAIDRFSKDPRENDCGLRELSKMLWDFVKGENPEGLKIVEEGKAQNEFSFQIEQFYKFASQDQYTYIAFAYGKDANPESRRLLLGIRNDPRYASLPFNARRTLDSVLAMTPPPR